MTQGFKTDLNTGDFVRENGQIVVIDGKNNRPNEAQLCAQRIRDALLTGPSEWFLDLDYGYKLITSPEAFEIQRSLTRNRIEAAAGEAFTLSDLGLVYDSGSRIMTLTYEVTMPDGETFSNTVELAI